MASASPTAVRTAREHRDRSGEAFERVTGGTWTPAETPPHGREGWGASTRRRRGSQYRRATGHGHGP